jgi:hypothetical protein
VSRSLVRLSLADASFKVFDLPFEHGQSFVQHVDLASSTEVKVVEKVADLLDGSTDDLDVLSIRPILLDLLLNAFSFSVHRHRVHDDCTADLDEPRVTHTHTHTQGDHRTDPKTSLKQKQSDDRRSSSIKTICQMSLSIGTTVAEHKHKCDQLLAMCRMRTRSFACDHT